MVNKNKMISKYVGLKNKNSSGHTMEIIKYESSKSVTVLFEDGTIVNASVGNFKNGQVKNPNLPSVFGVGIVGNKYEIRDKDGNISKEYLIWRRMIERCYSTNLRNSKNKTYSDCQVCTEWLYFPNFFEWLHSQNNFSKWFYGNYMIDKDIIEKGNKIYSPDKCCLVPYYINMLFTKHDSKRGKYPLGVIYNKARECFDVRVNDGVITGKKSIHLTRFSTPEEAFYKYKELKEKIIRIRAIQEYSQGNITKECFNGMLKYRVEITD